MGIQKPTIPKGTRDFSPLEMSRRNYIFSTIKTVFEKYGYAPIETPSMENLSTLMGKYGEEGDKLLFKVLNSGDFLSKVSLENTDSKKMTTAICEKGLRYDLTVPFARYVVMHQNELTFPFKRHQIQPVWRADRPQKGRYREFYQCDADIIGSKSLLNEAELVAMTHDVFKALKINIVIKLNNRKILSAIAELIGAPEKIIDITVAIDKLDKIGLENVNKELLEKGLTPEMIDKIQPIILLSGSNQEKIDRLKSVFAGIEIGLMGISEIESVYSYIQFMHLNCEPELDLTLARGLNYYTGAIFEVKATDAAMGSISGGGRYDDLTGIFGLKNMSGVGISYGADRIYDVLHELNLFPAQLMSMTKVLFCNFGTEEERYALPFLSALRAKGINCEIYPDNSKLNKQFSYANDKHIPFIVIGGTQEMEEQMFTIKNMETGEQKKVQKEILVQEIASLLHE
jgi:histidyl-tRNA synthetase